MPPKKMPVHVIERIMAKEIVAKRMFSDFEQAEQLCRDVCSVIQQSEGPPRNLSENPFSQYKYRIRALKNINDIIPNTLMQKAIDLYIGQTIDYLKKDLATLDSKPFTVDLIEINTALLDAIGTNPELLNKYKTELPLTDRMNSLIESQF